jgi:hypothetical protein
MARNTGTVVQNNLSRGLITEATGLNFPENAVTDADNVVFERVGKVRRRKGIDLEGSATAITYEDGDGLVKEFIWQAVAKTGGFTFLVLQLGAIVYFFELTQEESLSANVLPVSLNLNEYKAPGAGDLSFTPCSFASGAGYLFVSHPYTDPIIVRWSSDDSVFEAARVTLYIRDFEGVDDGLGVGEQPTTLSSAHHYNLQNQGWNQQVRVGTVNNEVGAGGSLGGEALSVSLGWTELT